MPRLGPDDTAYRARTAQPPVDRLIAQIARNQHGVIGRQQLRALGLSPQAIQRRVTAGRLHLVHRGVYAVGHDRLTDKGRWMAAVLACGPGAVLSHREAAAALQLRPSTRSATDVSSPGRRGRTIDGIDAHRADTLHIADIADIAATDTIPCTSVARTLLDLTEVVPRRDVERAIDQAEIQRIFDLNAIDDVLDRADGRHGAPILRAILSELRFGQTITRSQLEEQFLHICVNAALPAPGLNTWIHLPHTSGYSPDFVWSEQRLIVETDSRTYHDTDARFEHDRRRDQLLTIAGWRVVRFTWRQIFHEPEHVAATLRALLRVA